MNCRTPRVIPIHLWDDVYQSRWDAKVQADDVTGCLVWTGGKTCGYGMFALAQQNYRAHRIAYVLKHGNPAEPELVIDHLCRNRACVNPEHLEAVPQWVNFARGDAWNTHYIKSEACLRGHVMDDENTYTHPDGRRQCRTCLRMTPAERGQYTRGRSKLEAERRSA
jgi:hypothetical protein